MNSALMAQDLKDAETNLVVVGMFQDQDSLLVKRRNDNHSSGV